jgi:hypothetical protein
MTMIVATTKWTVMQNGGDQRVFATKWVRCCQRSSLRCVQGQAGAQQRPIALGA